MHEDTACLVSVFDNVLPASIFEALRTAVYQAIFGRSKGLRHYRTTFWHDNTHPPGNIVEACAALLLPTVQPPRDCIGIEWWLGCLAPGKSLTFHFDRDLVLFDKMHEIVHPLLSSILYFNHFASSPTVILDQVWCDGGGFEPPLATRRWEVEPVPNRYALFTGNLRHGVTAHRTGWREKSAGREPRLSLVINYWHRRPLGPICREYDGSIYPELHRPHVVQAHQIAAMPTSS